jgi:hypothetical protein
MNERLCSVESEVVDLRSIMNEFRKINPTPQNIAKAQKTEAQNILEQLKKTE